MTDELRPPPDPRGDVGDSLEIIISDGPDGEAIVDTVLRDRTGISEIVRRSGKPAFSGTRKRNPES